MGHKQPSSVGRFPYKPLPLLNTRHGHSSAKDAETALSRETRQADLAGALSGYGHKVEYCPEGIPVEQALFAILASFAAAFGFLFRAITMATATRRRKKRAAGNLEPVTWEEVAQDLLWSSKSRLDRGWQPLSQDHRRFVITTIDMLACNPSHCAPSHFLLIYGD